MTAGSLIKIINRDDKNWAHFKKIKGCDAFGPEAI